MNWAAILPELDSILRDITGLQVIREGEPMPFISDVAQAILVFEVFASQPVGGKDDLRWTQNLSAPSGSELTAERTGPRRFTFSVRCDSYNQTDTKFAPNVLENLRTSMDLPSINDRLDAISVTYTRSEKLVELKGPRDSHVISMASIDFIMGAVDSATDTPIGYIATAGVTSHLTVGGVDLPAPPNFTEVLP